MRRCGAAACGTVALLYRSQKQVAAVRLVDCANLWPKQSHRASYIVDFLPELCGERKHANLAARRKRCFLFFPKAQFRGQLAELKIVEDLVPSWPAHARAYLLGQPRVRSCCPFRFGLLDSPCAVFVLCLVQNMQLAVPEDASIREQGRQEVRPRAREGMCECSGRAPAFILSP